MIVNWVKLLSFVSSPLRAMGKLEKKKLFPISLRSGGIQEHKNS